MKDTLSKSMAWLHTWSGLVVGWLLFVIFVGGTIACFDKELDDWAQPWLHDTTLPAQPRFDAAIARTIVAVGHELHMVVAAEGVETQEQADFLREMGCDELQGYHFGRPAPAAEIEARFPRD